MVKSPRQRREIRIYVEGGSSDSKANKAFRRGWFFYTRQYHQLHPFNKAMQQPLQVMLHCRQPVPIRVPMQHA